MANGQSPLVKDLDKISYIVAGVLGLVLLGLAVFSGGGLKDSEAKVRKAQKELASKSTEFPKKDVPQIRSVLEDQWKVAESGGFPAWVSERRPAIVQWVEAAEIEKVAHEAPPSVQKIEYRRHAERMQPYLRVTASLGTINFDDKGEFADVTLLRRAGAEGEFVEVNDADTAAAIASGTLEYDDFQTASGQVFAYKITSTIRTKADAENAELASEPTLESEVLEITDPLPYDYLVNIINARSFDPATGKDAHFFGGIKFADYSKDGEIVTLPTKEYPEGFEFGPKWGPKKRSLWIIRPIDNGKLTVVNTKTRSKDVVTGAARTRSVELPDEVLAPEPVEDDGSEIGEEDGANTGAAESGATAPEPTPEEKPDTGKKDDGGLFK